MRDSVTVLEPAAEDATHGVDRKLPFSERLTCSVAEACSATGLGRTKIYELIAQGAIVTKNVGRRRLVLVQSLRNFVDGVP